MVSCVRDFVSLFIIHYLTWVVIILLMQTNFLFFIFLTGGLSSKIKSQQTTDLKTQWPLSRSWVYCTCCRNQCLCVSDLQRQRVSPRWGWHCSATCRTHWQLHTHLREIITPRWGWGRGWRLVLLLRREERREKNGTGYTQHLNTWHFN